MRRGALRSALSERLREGNLIIIDEFNIDNPKTRGFINILSTMELADKKNQTKTLIVDSLDNTNLVLASRNVKKTKITNGYGLNIYDLIYHEKLLISKAALAELNHLLDPNREKGTEAEVVEETPTVEKPKAKKEAKPKVKKEEPIVEETSPTVEAENNEETEAAE